MPETADDLVDWIERNPLPRDPVAPGFEGGALFTLMTSTDTIGTMSHWPDGPSITAYAGGGERSPVVYDEDRRFLVGEPPLEHFVRVHLVPPSSPDETAPR